MTTFTVPSGGINNLFANYITSSTANTVYVGTGTVIVNNSVINSGGGGSGGWLNAHQHVVKGVRKVNANGDLIDDDDWVFDIRLGDARTIRLPDGTKIDVLADGSYTVNDKDSKVVYKGSSSRDFNKYMNASDLIEDFIKDVGKLGVTQGQLLKLPINALFVWLVMKAAEADGEKPPADVPKLESLPEVRMNIKPKCKCCGRFIDEKRHALGVNFCSSQHMDMFMLKAGAA